MPDSTLTLLDASSDTILDTFVVTDTFRSEVHTLTGQDLLTRLPEQLADDAGYEQTLARVYELVHAPAFAASSRVLYGPPIHKEAHGSIPAEDMAYNPTINAISSDAQGTTLYTYSYCKPIVEDTTKQQDMVVQLTNLIAFLNAGRAEGAVLRRVNEISKAPQEPSVVASEEQATQEQTISPLE